jgi:photosystem II stability/assembly factor-like uncharacterized protein
VSFISSSTGMMISDSLVFKTTDGGESWTSTVVASSLLLSNVQYVDEQTALANGVILPTGDSEFVNQVFRTTDGGATWTPTFHLYGYRYNFGKMAFRDTRNGVMCGSSGVLYRISDAGLTWDSLHTPA